VPNLTVYIDFKSPYAYLAIEPTRRLAKELQIEVDWYPFVLDIPSYLGSARLDKIGKVEQQSRSEEQWSAVKYAYYDCRRYANLRGLTIRGTEKIWDTNTAAIGMLWAMRQGPAVLDAYINGIYLPFWKRELDLEDVAVVEKVLDSAGATTAGFQEYASGEGRSENDTLQTAAFDSGIFGVPTYVIGKEMYFGREHLPRIRWQLTGETGPAPDIANPLFSDDVLPRTSARRLDVGIDLTDYACQAAINAIRTLAEDTGIEIHWYPISVSSPLPADGATGTSRSARHRRYRIENYRRDLARDALEREYSAEELGIEWNDDGQRADWAGSGKLGGPTFRLGDEVFVGRQHLPLIRAMLLQR
jgi:2-hydroxychromene-2-carboxylate isomerase